MLTMLLGGCNQNQEIHYIDDREGIIDDYNGYYGAKYSANIDYADRGLPLISKLHNLMVDSHLIYTTYGSLSKIDTYKKSCLNPSTGKVVFFYTGKEVSSGSVSREHVWCCANSGGLYDHKADKDSPYYVDADTYKGAGSDYYHVMPTTSSVNSARGNSKFTEFGPNDTYNYSDDGGKYRLKVSSGNRCEVDDAFKGDVARIICYLYVHYNVFGKSNQYMIASNTLRLINIIDPAAGETAEETLARWNAIDPVDDVERKRNELVSGVQGNRNPFIDHPEFVWKMFDLGE